MEASCEHRRGKQRSDLTDTASKDTMEEDELGHQKPTMVDDVLQVLPADVKWSEAVDAAEEIVSTLPPASEIEAIGCVDSASPPVEEEAQTPLILPSFEDLQRILDSPASEGLPPIFAVSPVVDHGLAGRVGGEERRTSFTSVVVTDVEVHRTDSDGLMDYEGVSRKRPSTPLLPGLCGNYILEVVLWVS